MAAPHLGHRAVPGGTSTRQREHAGNRSTSFLQSGTRGSGYRGPRVPLSLCQHSLFGSHNRDRVQAEPEFGRH
jgi:hypothetical protein